MPATFQRDGVSFTYPENWQIVREDCDGGWSVSVQSPDTAFFLLTFDEGMPDIGAMTETVLEALKAEYEGLEAEEAVESIAGRPALGHNLRFFSLDLTNTCWTRSFQTGRGTVLVMCQTSDLDLETTEPVLRAMIASIRVQDDDE